MKLHYYPETDSLYVEFKTTPGTETREITDGLNVDLDAKGEVVGFDIDHASKRLDLATLETTSLPLHATRAVLTVPRRKQPRKTVSNLTHDEAKRLNIPTAEYEAVLDETDRSPIQVAYLRRNPDLDPQLVWRGKDLFASSDLVVQAPPLFIQEKVHPKALIDDLISRTRRNGRDEAGAESGLQGDLFADFNGLPHGTARTEFYRHDASWSNRMILGDSLHVMASLADREGLRGKVQALYIDPPYGIKFNSNFQWSTNTRTVRDGQKHHITREPEQVKAFRDTWRDGIHSYLSYLRDRLTVARELLTESGSLFVQIGDENVHRVRSLMDEVLGSHNFISQIIIRKTTSEGTNLLGSTVDYVLWYGRNREETKFRPLYRPRSQEATKRYSHIDYDGKRYRLDNITSSRPAGKGDVTSFEWNGREFNPGNGTFKTTAIGLERLNYAGRLYASQRGKLNYRRFYDDFAVAIVGNLWVDISGAVQSRSDPKVYVVQSSTQLIQRCLLLATDPGDLVLDPTCGAGTTAYVAEQWGRRWITIDTSRVALALARARIMGARYPYYLLTDSPEGQRKQSEVARTAPSEAPTYGNIRQGFVCQRVPHITLGSIANNTEIDVAWGRFQESLESLRARLNHELGKAWEEWEIPHEADAKWSAEVRRIHTEWWERRIARQEEINDSIAAKADYEYLYDRPYEDQRTVRVAGPFTVESISPHRTLAVGEDDETIDPAAMPKLDHREKHDFDAIIVEHLKTSGVQQAHKEDRISFASVLPWPGELVVAEGVYYEGTEESSIRRRAAILIGSEFGTVTRPDLAQAAREAGESGFDILIACAFNYDAHSTELARLGRIPILKARINADLHMAGDLRNTGKGNLFVIFGEPDIDILDADNDQIQVKINGVDVYRPSTGEIQSDNADGIACWFIDTDYNEESFFVRHAYFLGANDPYKALKTTLKAEINREAWETLRSDTSRPFDKPKTGRIAVKVINHLGDEVMIVRRA